MIALAFVLTVALLSAALGPRKAGRHIAKVVIGYRAQLRDEGESP